MAPFSAFVANSRDESALCRHMIIFATSVTWLKFFQFLKLMFSLSCKVPLILERPDHEEHWQCCLQLPYLEQCLMLLLKSNPSQIIAVSVYCLSEVHKLIYRGEPHSDYGPNELCVESRLSSAIYWTIFSVGS